ncbi:MAG: tRNA lysidine(34) synthetase TilS [Pseudomonadota bacterium]
MRDEELEALFQPLAGFEHLLLAVSGGADSLALLLLAHRWQATAHARSRAHRRIKPPRLTVAAIDHGLRPEAADEVAHVATVAGRLDIPFVTRRLDLTRTADQPISQAHARSARYDALCALAEENTCDAIVTAHHADDQAETFLMRLARGSSARGLAGIAPRRDLCVMRPDGSDNAPPATCALVRPLLNVPRARLAVTLEQAGIAWHDDPTNADVHYERTRVRSALGALEDAGVSRAAINRTASRLRQHADAVDWAVREALAAAPELAQAWKCSACAVLERHRYEALPAAVRICALGALTTAVSGRTSEPFAHLPAARLTQLETLADALIDVTAPAAWTLGGCALSVGETQLTIARELGRAGLGTCAVNEAAAATGWDNRFVVRPPAAQEGRRPAQIFAWGERGQYAPGTDRPQLSWCDKVPAAARPAMPVVFTNMLHVPVHAPTPRDDAWTYEVCQPPWRSEGGPG